MTTEFEYEEKQKRLQEAYAELGKKGPVRNDVWDAMCYYSKHFNLITYRSGQVDVVNKEGVLLEQAFIDVGSPQSGINEVKEHVYLKYDF